MAMQTGNTSSRVDLLLYGKLSHTQSKAIAELALTAPSFCGVIFSYKKMGCLRMAEIGDHPGPKEPDTGNAGVGIL